MKDEQTENIEEVETKEMAVAENNYSITDFSGIGGNSNTKTEVFTNITDKKRLFNLENKVDTLLNDCEGELIRVKEVFIKRYEKPMKEPIIDEETGEVLKDKEYSMSCVLVDENGKSYATGSKIFTMELMRYLRMRELDEEKEETFDIKIIKKEYGEKRNKALSFELV